MARRGNVSFSRRLLPRGVSSFFDCIIFCVLSEIGRWNAVQYYYVNISAVGLSCCRTVGPFCLSLIRDLCQISAVKVGVKFICSHLSNRYKYSSGVFRVFIFNICCTASWHHFLVSKCNRGHGYFLIVLLCCAVLLAFVSIWTEQFPGSVTCTFIFCVCE
jgi:hypothetical protein